MTKPKISEAEKEQLDIETKICIVRMQITKYTTILESNLASEEMLANARTILAREKKYLYYLKNKYPEHFI